MYTGGTSSLEKLTRTFKDRNAVPRDSIITGKRVNVETEMGITSTVGSREFLASNQQSLDLTPLVMFSYEGNKQEHV